MKTKIKLKNMTIILALLLGFGVMFMGTETVSADAYYDVSIIDENGNPGGMADPPLQRPGEKVDIVALYPYEGQAFGYWDNANKEDNDFDAEEELDDYQNPKTWFLMPPYDLVLTPHYVDILVDDIPDQVYTGQEIRPDVGKVELKGIDAELIKGKDYRVSYINNINAGTATARIKIYYADHAGPDKGYIDKKFKITPADFSQVDVDIEDCTYTGKAIEPPITVTWRGRTLKKDVDYTVTCKNNVNPGPVDVILKGKGNFDGVVNTTFTIKGKPAPKVSGVLLAKATAKGKTSLTFGWAKVEGADGYDIFFSRCDHKGKKITMKNVKTIEGNKIFSYTKKGLKKKTAYKASVKAYVMKDSNKTYIKTSPEMHAYTGGFTKKYTNAKAVKVNKTKVTLTQGKTFKVKAKVKKLKKNKKLMPKGHVAKIRYLSSDSSVATVSKSGKITAKGKGTCTIVAFAHNGVSKNIKVTVK